jgi:hypothetical protein
MIDRRDFLCAAGAALFAGPALAAAPILVSEAGLIFLAISVNGRPAKALVDTGSVRGVQLSEVFAGQVGLTLSDSGQTTQRYQGGPRTILRTRLASLAFGGVERSHVEAFVSPGDIEAISGQIGEPFDAILGWPILSAQAFTIDYSARSFEPSDTTSGGLALPLERGRALPVTAGLLAGQPLTFLIDTGAPWCNVDQGLAAGAAANSRVDLGFEIGGRAFTATFRVRDLGAMTRGVGARAVIGHRFLRDFRLAWGPGNGAMRLIGAAAQSFLPQGGSSGVLSRK